MTKNHIYFSLFFTSSLLYSSVTYSAVKNGENQCRQILTQTEVPYASAVNNDLDALLELSQYNPSQTTDYDLPPRMQSFRDTYLSLLRDPIRREGVLKSFEARMRFASYAFRRTLLAKDVKPILEYDAVVGGTGVAGITSAAALLEKKPEARILFIEQGDTGGGTFRLFGDFININSSNRQGGRENRPLPGEGDLNTPPGAVVTVPELSPKKYPTSNIMATPQLATLYALLSMYPNVDIAFQSTILSIVPNGRNNPVEINFSIDDQATFTAKTTVPLGAFGAGELRIPPAMKKRMERDPRYASYIPGDAEIPPIITYEDLGRITNLSNNPKKNLANKIIFLSGDGDSAFTALDFILGYASTNAYGSSTAQDDLPKKVYWIGQDEKTCERLNQILRLRYTQIGTGLRSSSQRVAPLVEAIPGRITDSVRKGGGQYEAILKNGERIQGDQVILATGTEKNLRALFPNGHLYSSDEKFIEAEFIDVTGEIPTETKRVKIGKKLRDGSNVLLTGIVTGPLVSTEKLFNVVQNTVAIFINGVRSYAMGSFAASLLPQNQNSVATEIAPLSVTSEKGNDKYVIAKIEETRLIPTQSISVLRGIFKDAVQLLENNSGGTKTNKITLSLASGDENSTRKLNVKVEGKGNFKVLVDLLAESRSFFSLSYEVLRRFAGQKEIVLEVTPGDGKTYSAEQSQLTLTDTGKGFVNALKGAILVENRLTPLRGIRGQSTREAPSNGSLSFQYLTSSPTKRDLVGASPENDLLVFKATPEQLETQQRKARRKGIQAPKSGFFLKGSRKRFFEEFIVADNFLGFKNIDRNELSEPLFGSELNRLDNVATLFTVDNNGGISPQNNFDIEKYDLSSTTVTNFDENWYLLSDNQRRFTPDYVLFKGQEGKKKQIKIPKKISNGFAMLEEIKSFKTKDGGFGLAAKNYIVLYDKNGNRTTDAIRVNRQTDLIVGSVVDIGNNNIILTAYGYGAPFGREAVYLVNVETEKVTLIDVELKKKDRGRFQQGSKAAIPVSSSDGSLIYFIEKGQPIDTIIQALDFTDPDNPKTLTFDIDNNADIFDENSPEIDGIVANVLTAGDGSIIVQTDNGSVITIEGK